MLVNCWQTKITKIKIDDFEFLVLNWKQKYNLYIDTKKEHKAHGIQKFLGQSY